MTEAASEDTGRFQDLTGEGLRGRAARGTMVNSAFLIGLNLMGLVKGIAVAGFITVADYGVWGLVIVVFTTLYGLVQIGVDDKYIQQDAGDQQHAFQLAFTLQLILSGLFVALIVVAMPLYALAYGTWEVLLPGWVLALALPASAFQAPLWTFYRRMDYLKQRRLQALDPVVGVVVTLGCAIAGLGYWSFVIGTICGAWAAAAVAVRASPYPLALTWERGAVREYASFSGPLMFNGACIAVMSLGPVFVAQRTLGTAAVGAMAIANNISVYANKVDDVVTSTIYPAIAAVKGRRDLLEETFLKSNRMGLLWAAPTGIGIALFAPDLVHFVLGSRWESAIALIQAFGLIAAFNQIGFNWTAFFRAIGDTRPIAVAGLAMAIAVSAIAVPLLFTDGLSGYAVGMGIAAAVLVVVRLVYLRRLFSLAPILSNVAGGIFPAAVAVTGAAGLRAALWGGQRTEGQALLELAVFAAIALGVTLVSQRGLVREFRGYLRRPTERVG